MNKIYYFCIKKAISVPDMPQKRHKHCIMRTIAGLPLGVLYLVSDLAYYVLYYIVRYRRKVVHNNLLNAFPEKSISERRKIEKAFYHSLCDIFIESFKTLNISDKELRERVQVYNYELPERIAGQGRSSLMLLGHCGCWEWCQEICLRYKAPKRNGELYKRINNMYFGSLMHKIRSHWDTEQIEMHNAVRTILQWNKEGEPFLIGFICDQRPETQAKGTTTFLTQKTGYIPGAEEIGRKINAELIYLDVERTSRGHYRLTFYEMNIQEHLKNEKFPITQLYWQMLEGTIRRQPEIWLWSHKRWS